MSRWEAREGAANSEWAYHIQNSGARQHRRSSQMPTFKWTGELRPALVSPRRRVPSVGWLTPPPDYARSGWPEAEFASPLQHKLEVKTPEQLAKMKAACSLGRAVMDAVAAAIKPVRSCFVFLKLHVLKVRRHPLRPLLMAFLFLFIIFFSIVLSRMIELFEHVFNSQNPPSPPFPPRGRTTTNRESPPTRWIAYATR